MKIKLKSFLIVIFLLSLTTGARAQYNLNLENISIKEFIQFVSEFTGENIVYNDQDLRGNITIESQQEMTSQDILDLFYATLRVNNLYAIEKENYVQVIKYTDMKDYPDKLTDKASEDGKDIITTILFLEYINSQAITTAFNKLKSRTGNVDNIKNLNAIIVRDSENRIKKMMNIAKELEKKASYMSIYSIDIKNTTASNVEAKLTRFYGEMTKQGMIGSLPVIFADDFSNILIVASNDKTYKQIQQIIASIDVTGAGTRGSPKVFYLKNAVSEDVEEVLNKLLSETSPDQKIINYSVASDKSTNSIITIGDQELYNKVETLIEKLDKPRKQVYVEALIIETSLSKSLDFGVEWQAAGTNDGTVYGAAGFLQGGGLGSFQSHGTKVPPLPGGFSMGILGDVVTYNGIEFHSISAMVHAIRTDSGINIMSNPQILTLDNEDAEVFVGENRPFQTSTQYDANNNPVQNFEYKDIGVTLKITPLISSSDEITLNVEQEIKQVHEVAGLTATQPATLTRRTKTRVKLNDGATMVIGGLIGDDSTITEGGVPLLSKIPLLGWLFKSKSRNVNKTNMMVFISTHIINSYEDADNLTERKKISNDDFKENINKELK